MAAPEVDRQAPAGSQALIGAWRLMRIERVGPNGSMLDPFYNADATGVLIYDASGWMSVQIANQPRPFMEAPESRPRQSHTAESAQLEAAVLDTYYAYAGTWKLDTSTMTVTHQVVTSLIPAEVGLSYSQTLTLDGEHLIFTRRAGAITQRKVWRRIASRTD